MANPSTAAPHECDQRDSDKIMVLHNHIMLCSLVLIQIAAFPLSGRHQFQFQFQFHALRAAKMAQKEPVTSSRLKRTKGFVDWAEESGIK